VHVAVPDLGVSDAHFDQIVVRVGLTFSPRQVEVRGGAVALSGSADELLRRLRERKGSSATEAPSGDRKSLDLSLDGVDLRWEGALEPADVTTVQGLRFERTGDSGKVGAARAEWASAASSVAAREVAGTFSRNSQRGRGIELEQLDVKGLDLRITAPEAPAAAEAQEPDRDHEREESAAGEGFAWLRRVGSLRTRLLSSVGRSIDSLSPNALLAIDEIRLALHRGSANLNAGPGSARVHRDGGSLAIDLEAGAGGEHASPISIHARIPTTTESHDPIAVQLEGGPVTLAALGVHEGDFGLLEVDRATIDARAMLSFPADGASISFQGRGKLASISLDDRRLADDPVRGLELGWKAVGSGALDGSRLAIEEGELALGEARARAHGILESSAGAARVNADIAVPAVECQKMLDSIPQGLIPKLTGLRIAGVFAIDSHIAIDTRKPADADLDWHLANRCRIVSTSAELDASRFSQPFHHTGYDAEGQKIDLTAGPGTPDWVPLTQMSRYLEAAVLTTEDGGFRSHGGFDKGAIRNSIRDDLKAGKFLRGASTISMQLAKNLYLEREKNLSRKLQEAFLTMYLEQTLSKDEILELYFNVVEFGPMVYGIGPAADTYFHTSANDLTLGQSLFLVSILPSPKRQYFTADGHLSKGYSAYMHRLMQIMFEKGRIDERELAEGLSEVLVLGSPRPEHAADGGAGGATVVAGSRNNRGITVDGP
jgi:hypothetical protein